MRFSRIFVGGLTLLLALTIAGGSWLIYNQTRDYVHNQLFSHAHDTANALGLSLREPLASGDIALADTMITALLESGYYQQIVLVDAAGTVLVERDSRQVTSTTPTWVQRLFPLQPPAGEIMINNGWDIAGHLQVMSHPALGYQFLWQTLLKLTAVLVTASVALGASIAWWSRGLRRGMARVQRVVIATARLHTDTTPQSAGPVELRSLLRATWLLSRRFQRLALKDGSTGLNNRRAFDFRLRRVVTTLGDDEQGHLLLVRLSSFESVRSQLGKRAATGYLLSTYSDIGATLSSDSPPDGFRLSDSELAMILPPGSCSDIEALGKSLSQRFKGVTTRMHPQGIGHIGIVAFSRSDHRSTILAGADWALCEAEHKGKNQWHQRDAGETLSTELSRYLIEQQLESPQLRMYRKPAFTGDSPQPVYHHLQVRHYSRFGTPLPINQLLDAAEDLAVPMDKLLIQRTIWLLLADPNDDNSYGITLSGPSLADEHFVDQLEALIQPYPLLCPRLVFEINEHDTMANLEHCKKLREMLDHYEARLSINAYQEIGDLERAVEEVRPAYAKLDWEIVQKSENDEYARKVVKPLWLAANRFKFRIVTVPDQQEFGGGLRQELGISERSAAAKTEAVNYDNALKNLIRKAKGKASIQSKSDEEEARKYSEALNRLINMSDKKK